MNRFRHYLAERLHFEGAPDAMLDMCGHTKNLRSISPARDRGELNKHLRDAYEDYYDEDSCEWVSEASHTPEEANYMANALHRYRLFTFSNFLTTLSMVDTVRKNLIEILTDAHPGSVLLLIGGKTANYSDIYRYVAGLARDAGFSLEAECPEVSCSDAGMDRLVHAEQVWFYRRLRAIGGDLSAGDPVTRELRREFEDEKPDESPKSAVRAWRK